MANKDVRNEIKKIGLEEKKITRRRKIWIF